MPDRTKMGRTAAKTVPTYIETDNPAGIQSDLAQSTQINRAFGQPLLDTYAVQSVENQQAGPAASFEQYDPTGSSSVKRAGLGGATNGKSRLTKMRVP